MAQNDWNLDDEGMIRQTQSDKQDPDVRLFSEVACWHNQAIEDAKKAEEV